MINLIEYTQNELSKCRRKKCLEINDDLQETYNSSSQNKIKTMTFKSSLYGYTDRT